MRVVGGVTLVALAAGLVMAFGVAPREMTQGNVQQFVRHHETAFGFR